MTENSFLRYSFELRHAARFLRNLVFRDKRLAIGPFNFYLLSERPKVVLTFTMGGLGHVEHMCEQVFPDPIHLLVGLWWNMAREERIDIFRRQLKRIERKYPNASIHILCNSTEEFESLTQKLDNPTHHISSNCFVDESIFTTPPRTPKRFAALYNARLGPYKRLELAKNVTSLAIITAPYLGGFSNDYARQMRMELAHATWLNDGVDGRYKRISVNDLPEIIKSAHAGLVLSAEEGACYAAVEYLLCGVPVVTTPSVGGRDEFFCHETAITVAPVASAVAEGVKLAASRLVDANRIRELTVGRMQIMRGRFCALVDAIKQPADDEPKFVDQWPNLFSNKMNYKCSPEIFTEILSRETFDIARSCREP